MLVKSAEKQNKPGEKDRSSRKREGCNLNGWPGKCLARQHQIETQRKLLSKSWGCWGEEFSHWGISQRHGQGGRLWAELEKQQRAECGCSKVSRGGRGRKRDSGEWGSMGQGWAGFPAKATWFLLQVLNSATERPSALCKRRGAAVLQKFIYKNSQRAAGFGWRAVVCSTLRQGLVGQYTGFGFLLEVIA